MRERLHRPAIFLAWSVGACFAAYCVVGLILGAWPFLFYAPFLFMFLGLALVPTLAGTIYLYAAGKYPSGFWLAAILAMSTLVPALGHFLLLLGMEPLGASYAATLLLPILGGGLVAGIVGFVLWSKIG